MKFIRSHISFRLLWLLLALHIFNCSIDAPDGQPAGEPEDLSVNDIESVLELVLEKALLIENAISEYDEHDADDEGGISLKKGVNSYINFYSDFSIVFRVNFILNNIPKYKITLFTVFYPENISPPPEV
jgi:hypothetical protein